MLADVAPAIQAEVMRFARPVGGSRAAARLARNRGSQTARGAGGRTRRARRSVTGCDLEPQQICRCGLPKTLFKPRFLLASTETLEAFAGGLTEAFIDGETPVDADGPKRRADAACAGPVVACL